MQKVITATGKEFNVNWCGQATIDFVLRFEVVNSTMANILSTFMNPVETEKLTHIFDENRAVYTGFTQFKGVDLKPSGTIVVALMEETA